MWQKLKTEYYVRTMNGLRLNKTLTRTYCGNYIYENNDLVQVLFDGGYITFNGSDAEYHYYIQDHLGNNRIVAKTRGVPEQTNHYYPFGPLMGTSTDGDTQRYKYNGKELDRMNGLDLYDYGARLYDGIRFTTMDPLAEKYYSVSPYAYCGNNPIMFIDPDGMDYWSTNDPNEIASFMSSMKSGKQYDLSNWNHTTDSDFLANLSYNDVTNRYYYSYGTEVDGEVVCYGVSFSKPKNISCSSTCLAIAGALAVDDASVIGVADDIAIPIFLGVAAAGLLYDSIYGNDISSLGYTQQAKKDAIRKSQKHTPSQAKAAKDRGQAPKEIDRIEAGHTPKGKYHAHGRNGGALNIDGTYHDGNPRFSRKTLKWLESYGWNIR